MPSMARPARKARTSAGWRAFARGGWGPGPAAAASPASDAAVPASAVVGSPVAVSGVAVSASGAGSTGKTPSGSTGFSSPAWVKALLRERLPVGSVPLAFCHITSSLCHPVSMASLEQALRAAGFRGELAAEVALAPYTTWRIGGPAELLATPTDVDDLRSAVAWAAERGVPWRVLGNGSNLLVREAGVRGLVLR